MKWMIVFDRDLENPIDTVGEFNSCEEAVKFLDSLDWEETEQLYNQWCDENGIEEDERAFSDELEITIIEMVQFAPKIDADTILDHIREQADEFGGEYSDGYLKRVTDEQLLDLEYALSDAFTKWSQKYRHTPYFYQVGKEKTY